MNHSKDGTLFINNRLIWCSIFMYFHITNVIRINASVHKFRSHSVKLTDEE